VFVSSDPTLDAGDTLGAVLTVPALGPGEHAVVSYTYGVDWDAASGRLRWFIAQADAGFAIGEPNEQNNTRSRSVGVSLLPYDVNGGGSVDGTDQLLVVQALNSDAASLQWNPDADQPDSLGLKDGVITGGDQLAVALHFGESDAHVETSWLDSGPAEGAAPLMVAFRYEAYYYVGTVVLVEVDFDGDGIVDEIALGPAQRLTGAAMRTFDAPGTYTALIRATDSAGHVDVSELPITVK
jgi:hypothetical protein